MALKTAVQEHVRDVEILLRESPVGDPQANGASESAVREVKKQMRVMLSSTEQAMGRPVPEKHPLTSWHPRRAAFCLSKYRPGLDRRTPEQKRVGRAWSRPTVPFGERVLFARVPERRG